MMERNLENSNSTNRQPPPGPIKRPRRTEVRRRLLEASLVEFAQYGYERASLDRVAAAAGFSKGAIYSNFTNKEDLFLTLMDHQVRERVQSSRELVSAASDPDNTPEMLGQRLTAAIVADTDWQLLFLDYVTRAARDPAAGAEFARRRRLVRTTIAEAVTDFFGPDHPLWNHWTPETIAVVVLAISNGLAIERLADPGSVPDDLFGQLLQRLL